MLAGLVMLKFPPSKINFIYGYRTPRSMKSQERWDFAQRYAARELLRIGGLTMVLAAVGFFFKPQSATGAAVAIALPALFAIVLIVRVERAIKKRFDSRDVKR